MKAIHGGKTKNDSYKVAAPEYYNSRLCSFGKSINEIIVVSFV